MTISTKLAATQVTHGLLYSVHKNRISTPAEHFMNMGLNVFPSIFAGGAFAVPWAQSHLGTVAGLDCSQRLTDASAKRLSGNGMSLSCIYPFLLFVLSRAEFTPRGSAGTGSST
jgi:hypothetical protein